MAKNLVCPPTDEAEPVVKVYDNAKFLFEFELPKADLPCKTQNLRLFLIFLSSLNLISRKFIKAINRRKFIFWEIKIDNISKMIVSSTNNTFVEMIKINMVENFNLNKQLSALKTRKMENSFIESCILTNFLMPKTSNLQISPLFKTLLNSANPLNSYWKEVFQKSIFNQPYLESELELKPKLEKPTSTKEKFIKDVKKDKEFLNLALQIYTKIQIEDQLEEENLDYFETLKNKDKQENFFIIIWCFLHNKYFRDGLPDFWFWKENIQFLLFDTDFTSYEKEKLYEISLRTTEWSIFNESYNKILVLVFLYIMNKHDTLQNYWNTKAKIDEGEKEFAQIIQKLSYFIRKIGAKTLPYKNWNEKDVMKVFEFLKSNKELKVAEIFEYLNKLTEFKIKWK
ncbi:hypothetical protein [Mycoplasmopsis glycophila]|nr:hypothetical protein [Mycoplasmopsis glycophila]